MASEQPKDSAAAVDVDDVANSLSTSGDEAESEEAYVPLQEEYSFLQRQAMRMARWPKTHFWVGFAVSFGLSAVGMILGNFSISNEEGGWQSRGTLIADRTTQILMVDFNTDVLFPVETNEPYWEDVTTVVQPGWELGSDDDDEERRLERVSSYDNGEVATSSSFSSLSFLEQVIPTSMTINAMGGQVASKSSQSSLRTLRMPHENEQLRNFFTRKLQENNSTRLEGCDREWYTHENVTSEARLWPVWKATSLTASALDPALVQELCVSEEQTQRVLEEQGLCISCTDNDSSSNSNNRCLPPYGIVMYARLLVPGGMDMDCGALASAWAPYQSETVSEWRACVEFVEANIETVTTGEYREVCPDYFHPALVDERFDDDGVVQYTSSVFATTEAMVNELYDIEDQFDRGGVAIEGAYDTQEEDFLQILADGAVESDMLLAMGSAFITTIAILVHTRSPFLTLVGLVQIILSFPLAFFVYRFLGGFEFFPFLNFIGVFVVFALGADHVFVSVDKWKNARLDHPKATTEDVAAIALPDAAVAMLLTTITTAVAFFGTSICPVAPVRLFAIFCGLLITFDYVMDIVLIFPCLIIYDEYRHNTNCCISLGCCSGKKADDDDDDEEEEPVEATTDDLAINKAVPLKKQETTNETDTGSDELSSQEKPKEKPMRTSFIRRILLAYYNCLHSLRWPLLVASAAALVVSGIYAMQLELPVSGEVRIVSTSIEFEQAYVWRQNLLYETIRKQGGSAAYVVWGVVPADTGDHNDPSSWTTMVLDDTFDPSTEAAQEYLRDYCPRFFEQDFGQVPFEGYQCAMNNFDGWLKYEAGAAAAGGNSSDIYLEHCANATGLPMDPAAFSPCMIAWTQEFQDKSVLSWNGVVKTIIFPFLSRVRYDSPNQLLENEWNMIEDWMVADQATAPVEVNKAFFSSQDFWWYDTNIQMFRTAYGSAGIAIAASAIVILLSSRSLVMTLFSVLSIGYVLASVTAMMVAAGWTLGFLESICFAILIGVSVDFVIHFSHAYVAMPGEVDRSIRTRHALIDMGPSILAAAFTTMAGAVVMLFCVITFFTKFAFVLFFAIVQATIGSFVVFLTLTDCIGPTNPQYMANELLKSCKGKTDDGQKEDDKEEEVVAASEPTTEKPSPNPAPFNILDEEITDEIEV